MRLQHRLTKANVLTGLCLASAALMFLPACARWIRGAARPWLAPFSQAGTAVTVHLRTRVRDLTGRRAPAPDERVEALQQDLRARDETIQALRDKIDDLRRWRRTLEGFDCKLIDARVVASEAVPLRNRRLLAHADNAGVAAGDVVTTRRVLHELPVALQGNYTVLGRNYVVGRIVQAAAYTATLQLVTDRHFRMLGQLWRLVWPNGERTLEADAAHGARRRVTIRHSGRTRSFERVGKPIVVQATGDGRQIVLRRIPREFGVAPRDLLTTGDATGLVPFGLTIGRVTRTERDPQAPRFETVYVEPLADLDTLREVYILVPLARGGG